MARSLAVALLVGGPAGCDLDERLAPLDTGSGGATTTSSATGGGGTAPVDAGPVKRTVSVRSPWGGPNGNLLVDGDFELSIVVEGMGGQSGWYALSNQGAPRYLRGETGGLCRTGLRCGVLEPGAFLLGRGTAANGTGMIASMWVMPPPGKGCEVASAYAIRCSFDGNATDLLAVGEEPDTTGWCQYRTGVTEGERAMCLIVENTLAEGETALIDSVTLTPDDGTAPLHAMVPLSGERAVRAARASESVRRRLPLGPPPRLPVGAR
jgi:hypothetical protein